MMDEYDEYLVYASSDDALAFSAMPIKAGGLKITKPWEQGARFTDWLDLCSSCPLSADELMYPITIGYVTDDMEPRHVAQLVNWLHARGYHGLADAMGDITPREDDADCYELSLYESSECPYGAIREVSYGFSRNMPGTYLACVIFVPLGVGLVPYQVELSTCPNGDDVMSLSHVILGLNQYGSGALCTNAQTILEWSMSSANADIAPDAGRHGFQCQLAGATLHITPGYVKIACDPIDDHISGLSIDELLAHPDFINFIVYAINEEGAPLVDDRYYTIM